MKKKIIIIVSIIVILMLAVGGAYLIDKNRMNNNKPVIFSTWGYQYAPPEVIGEIVKITDRTVTENLEKNNTITIKYKSSDNINRLFEFVENTKVDSLNRIEDEIRVITHTIEGDPIIKDIKFVMNDEESYYEITTDNTRDKFGVPQVITRKYDASLYTIEATNNNEFSEVCLVGLAEANKPLELVSICPVYYMIKERSFIATIIEEEPTYLIVEPNDGELEKLQANTRKILIANGVNRDYFYGVGRKVIITYDNIIQSDTNTIIGATIDVDGYDKFELEVLESEELEKRKILSNKDLGSLNSDYDLYYYGLEEVNVKVNDKVMTLENALKDGYLTLSGILSKANKDRGDNVVSYDDGGSREYQYETFVIIKCHKLDGNRDMYICKAGTTLNDLFNGR